MIAKAYRRSSKSVAVDRAPLRSLSVSVVAGGGQQQDKLCVRSLERIGLASELDWLTSAAQLPGKSLHLAVALLVLAQAKNTRQVELSNSMSQKFGLNRNAKYRAFGWLEEAGLVRVTRKIGRSPVVTILDHGDGA
jgi:hypothetical protein